MSHNHIIQDKRHKNTLPLFGNLGVVIGLMSLGSGCAALAYELLYLRLITTLLGDMFYVHGALLGTFLIGIGFGALYAIHLIRYLWLIELSTGLYACIFPLIIKWISSESFFASITGSAYLTVGTTFALVIVPSLMIGCTLPVFSTYLKYTRPKKAAFNTAYGLYNLGAFISIFSVEYVLVKTYGIQKSLSITGAINVIIGVILAMLIFKSVLYTKKSGQISKTFDLSLSRFPFLPGISKELLISLIVASFFSAIFQIFFLKLTYLVFEPHRENFAISLAVVFIGIVIGTWISAKTKLRFSTCLLFIGLSISIIYCVYKPILSLYLSTIPLGVGSYSLIFVHRLVFACIFGLVPMIFFGALIPSLMHQEEHVASKAGGLLAVSSFSNAAGYLFYLYLGHPFFGTDILLGSVIFIISLLSIWVCSKNRRFLHSCIAVLSIGMAVTLIILWEDRYYYLAQRAPELRERHEVIVYKSGGESATLLEEINYTWLSYNGHPSIYIQKNDIVNTAEILNGVIPSLSAPRLDRALVLGFGAGITSGTTALLFKEIDVAEINQAFYQMSYDLREINFDIGNNPRADLHLVDGRALVNSKVSYYDAIINSIPAPTYYSASKIYTLEFYQSVARALTDRGVFSTWLSKTDMSQRGLEILLNTLRKVFPYCSLAIMRHDYYMVTCCQDPIERRTYSSLKAHSLITDRIQQKFPTKLDEFFEDIYISDNIFQNHNSNAVDVNTDDNPILEFELVRSYGLSQMGSDVFLENSRLYNIKPMIYSPSTDMSRYFRKARNYYQLNSGFYDKMIDVIDSSPELRSEWDETNY